MNSLAIDLGSSSIRGFLGIIEDKRIQSIREIARFPNTYVHVGSQICWDYVAMYRNILDVLSECRRQGIKLDSIGIDGWAQDYAFIGQDGEVLGLPRSYRDPVNLTYGLQFEKDNALDTQKFRENCGVAYIGVSTLRQLWHDMKFKNKSYSYARSFLFIPYLMIYLLTGVLAYDVSLPVLGELGDAETSDFSEQTVRLLGLEGKLPRRFSNGQVIGCTGQAVLEATGYDRLDVICTQSHDTTSAVSAIPDDRNFLWISCGSFNMLGAVLDSKIYSQAIIAAGFSNTPLADGRNCLMTGEGAGMYYIQQCLKSWRRKGINLTYDELTSYALSHRTTRSFDFTDLPLSSSCMEQHITLALKKAGYGCVSDPYEIYEAFSNSLAGLCVRKLKFLCHEASLDMRRIYMVSGGAKADDVDTRIAEAMEIGVVALLPEASAFGNLKSQWNVDIDSSMNSAFFEMRRF